MLDYEHRYVEWIWQNISTWYLLNHLLRVHKTWISFLGPLLTLFAASSFFSFSVSRCLYFSPSQVLSSMRISILELQNPSFSSLSSSSWMLLYLTNQFCVFHFSLVFVVFVELYTFASPFCCCPLPVCWNWCSSFFLTDSFVCIQRFFLFLHCACLRFVRRFLLHLPFLCGPSDFIRSCPFNLIHTECFASKNQLYVLHTNCYVFLSLLLDCKRKQWCFILFIRSKHWVDCSFFLSILSLSLSPSFSISIFYLLTPATHKFIF